MEEINFKFKRNGITEKMSRKSKHGSKISRWTTHQDLKERYARRARRRRATG